MKRKDVMLAELEQAVLVLEGYRRTKADLDDVMNAFQKMYLDYRAEKADPTNTKSVWGALIVSWGVLGRVIVAGVNPARANRQHDNLLSPPPPPPFFPRAP